jgi:hypothetical protein
VFFSSSVLSFPRLIAADSSVISLFFFASTAAAVFYTILLYYTKNEKEWKAPLVPDSSLFMPGCLRKAAS